MRKILPILALLLAASGAVQSASAQNATGATQSAPATPAACNALTAQNIAALYENLPIELEQPALPQAVLGLLIAIENFQERGMRDLMRIASDGKVSDDEIIPFGQALAQLSEMVRSAYAVGYSKE